MSPAMLSDERVVINVGGQKFETFGSNNSKNDYNSDSDSDSDEDDFNNINDPILDPEDIMEPFPFSSQSSSMQFNNNNSHSRTITNSTYPPQHHRHHHHSHYKPTSNKYPTISNPLLEKTFKILFAAQAHKLPSISFKISLDGTTSHFSTNILQSTQPNRVWCDQFSAMVVGSLENYKGLRRFKRGFARRVLEAGLEGVVGLEVKAVFEELVLPGRESVAPTADAGQNAAPARRDSAIDGVDGRDDVASRLRRGGSLKFLTHWECRFFLDGSGSV
ncbi:hypothetical protein HDU76_013826 [Blyttiomyces sp. JEL0837]|nr:hypothetical protein HDU76_013826 [Blyttiomyces sp. JEL0837]